MCVPIACGAHVFAQPYSLPVPFSLYAFGSGVALVCSFGVFGLFATAPRLARRMAESSQPVEAGESFGVQRPSASLLAARALSLALLLLCIATGLWGTRNQFLNLSMTFFWIVFVLAVPYATALVGDFYSKVNPWRVLVSVLEPIIDFTPKATIPARWRHVPALVLYIAFIWIELFAQIQPRGLGWALVGYSVINVGGAWVLGTEQWFRNGEFFEVMLRLIGRMAPWCPAGERDAMGHPNPSGHWRMPFSGLLEEPVPGTGLVLLILFMLSSTAFDGLHSTQPFSNLFWSGIYPYVGPLVATAPSQKYAVSAQIYYVWQWVALVASPWIYWVVFVVCVAMAKRMAGGQFGVGELVRRFSVSLIPIAFVYHVTHYYTVLLSQGVQIIKLASDPFGWGWNLFGTARVRIDPIMVDVNTIWHSQVALILAGHIVGTYLAHMEALRCFDSRKLAALSQIPLLALMVLFTTLGLWILSLPLVTGGG